MAIFLLSQPENDVPQLDLHRARPLLDAYEDFSSMRASDLKMRIEELLRIKPAFIWFLSEALFENDLVKNNRYAALEEEEKSKMNYNMTQNYDAIDMNKLYRLPFWEAVMYGRECAAMVPARRTYLLSFQGELRPLNEPVRTPHPLDDFILDHLMEMSNGPLRPILLQFKCIPATEQHETRRIIGPYGTALSSPAFRRNYTILRMQSREPWNDWVDPFYMYPNCRLILFYPQKNFWGSHMGFRPIGKGAGD
ncbi:Exostosin-3 [Eumeta japonica]|uniref:Exostosin-3 n=1 Tax=Eumeta variegata TaxID=151549 RepID=A0A4C1SBP3_EUMVA|nr:Exostosin-3 [Eumeta japonica]